jgi:hypothetical protein
MPLSNGYRANTAQYTIIRILTVNVKGRLVEGMLRDGGKVMVPIREAGAAFRWPRVDEVWSIKRNGLDWELCGRVRHQNEQSIESVEDNEVRLDGENSH